MGESPSSEDLEESLMAVRLLLANIENFKYVVANAEYLDKKEIANALKLSIDNMEPTLNLIQMNLELAILLQNPNAGA